MGGQLINPTELGTIDPKDICQLLYDSLKGEFGDELSSGYSDSLAGSWQYSMALDDGIEIYFPEGHEYTPWTIRQVEIDNETMKKT